MSVLIALVVLGLVGLLVWSVYFRKPPASTPPEGFRLPQRSAPLPTKPNPRPRFQGRGVVSRRDPFGRPPGTPGTGPKTRFAPRAPAPRFSGEVRRAPDAIGLACGRPIAECERGADCLCVD